MSRIVISGLAGVCLALAIGLYFCYNQVKVLEADSKIIRKELGELTLALDDEVRRGKIIAAATVRLERQDELRQDQFLQFTRTLGVLKQSDAEVRAALSITLPRVSLTGLRSFDAGSDAGGACPGESNPTFNYPGEH